jgi:uncharacterized protein with FMN-binding domain
MKKIVLAFASTVSVLVLLFGYHTSTSSELASSPPAAVSGGATGGSSSSSSGASGASGSSSSSGSDSSGSTVTGTVAQTRWGPVQVELSLDGDKITDVTVVQYPDGNGRDQEINSYALPILVQETVAAQSADIDMVSGATVTSVGYQQSLQSALDQASA